MNIGGNDLLVLDTNVLIHWTRQDATGQQLKSSLGLDRRTERPLVPTTVEGEIHRTGQNDMWIAAATMAVGGVLVTCDEDFCWMHPNHIRVYHVVQS